MEKLFSIAEVAKISNVNKETLRHWANMDLIRREKNTQNGYYEYSEKSLADISFILLHRSLEVPLLAIKSMSAFTHSNQLINIYNNLQNQINKKIEDLTENLIIIKNQIDIIYKAIQADKSVKECIPKYYYIYEVKKREITPLDYSYKGKWVTLYYFSEENYGNFIDGRFAVKKNKSKTLWEYDKTAKYFYFICSQINSSKDIKVKPYIEEIESLGFKPKHLLIKYLVSLPEGKDTRNYFETWVEAYPNK